MKKLFFMSLMFISSLKGMDIFEMAWAFGEELTDAQVREIQSVRRWRNAPNPNWKAIDQDLMIAAIKDGNEALVDDLIKQGSVPANAQDAQGRTLLHVAIKAKQPFIAGKIFAASIKSKNKKPVINLLP